MKKNSIVFGVVFSFVFLMSLLSVSASTQYVSFNGAWANGTTLYSNVFTTGNYTFYSTDVYPIKPIAKNCTTTTTCSVYNYHYETTCLVFNKYNRCIMTLKHRVLDDCKTFKTITKCVSPKIGCVNPVTGVYTNQLSLKSFKYSLDGSTWNVVPYNKLVVQNSQIQFKLDIPNVCSPDYYKDKAIAIGN